MRYRLYWNNSRCDMRAKLKIILKSIHPTFILLFLWFIFNHNISSFLTFFFVVLSHELGHYFMARRLGYKLDSFFIAPYGVSLNYKDKVFESKDEIKIAFAGPCVNFIFSFILVSFWWVIPEIYNFSYEFVFQSLMLGLFNLLPCYPLDGGRIFVGLISQNKPRNYAIKISIVMNIIIASLLLILFFISFFINFNPTLCLCAVMMILSVLDWKSESKYKPISLFKKKTKNFSKPFFITINGNITISQALKHVEVNKFTIFVVILNNSKTKLVDEQTLKILSMKYPINLSFDEIYTR